MYDSHDEESPPPPLEQQGGEHEWYNSRFGIGKGTAGKSKYPSKAKQNRMRNTRNKDKDDDYNGGGLKCGGLKDVEEGGNYAMVTTAGNFRSSTISALGMSGLFLDPKNVLDDLNKTANEYDEYEAQAIVIEEEEEARQQQQLQLQQQQQRKISSSSSSSSNRNIKKKIIQGQIERDKELKELEDVILNYKHDHKEQEEEEQRSRESSRDQEQKQRGLLKIASSPISKQQSKSDDYDDDDIEENNSSAVVVVESKMMSRHTKKRMMEMKIYYTIGIIIFITMCILFAYGGYIIYRNKHS
jgi:hypothetical protein